MSHWASLCFTQDQITNDTRTNIHFSNLHSAGHFMTFFSFSSLEINQGISLALIQILVVFFFLSDKTEQMFPAAPDLDSEAGLILSAQELQLKEVQFGRLRSDSPVLKTAGSFLPQLSAHIAVISSLTKRRASAEPQAAEFTRARRKHAQKDGRAGCSQRCKRGQNVTSLIFLNVCQ